MRIVLLGPAHPYRGGISAFNERLALELQNEGVDVKIVTFSLQYPGFLFPGKSQFRSDVPPLVGKLKIYRKLNSVNPLSWISTALFVKNRLKPDVVISRYWHPFIAPSVGTVLHQLRLSGILTTAIVDNAYPHENIPLAKPLTRYFLSSIESAVTLSGAVTAQLQKDLRFRKPILTLFHPLYDQFPNPVSKEAARKRLGIPEDRIVVLFFGFVRPYKGLDTLIKSAALIKTEPVIFVVAGEFYESPEKYTGLIKELSVRDNFIIHDEFVPDNEVHWWFCAADIVVQPYKSASQSGITPLAYYYNKPVIVTNTGALPEQVKHMRTGFIIPPDSPGELANSLKYFIEHKNSLEERMRAEIERIRQELSWNAFARALINWLKQHIV